MIAGMRSIVKVINITPSVHIVGRDPHVMHKLKAAYHRARHWHLAQ